METKGQEIQEENHVHDTSTPNLFNMKRARTKFWEHIMLIAPTNEKEHGIPKTLLERGV